MTLLLIILAVFALPFFAVNMSLFITGMYVNHRSKRKGLLLNEKMMGNVKYVLFSLIPFFMIFGNHFLTGGLFYFGLVISFVLTSLSFLIFISIVTDDTDPTMMDYLSKIWRKNTLTTYFGYPQSDSLTEFKRIFDISPYETASKNRTHRLHADFDEVKLIQVANLFEEFLRLKSFKGRLPHFSKMSPEQVNQFEIFNTQLAEIEEELVNQRDFLKESLATTEINSELTDEQMKVMQELATIVKKKRPAMTLVDPALEEVKRIQQNHNLSEELRQEAASIEQKIIEKTKKEDEELFSEEDLAKMNLEAVKNYHRIA